MRDWERIWRGAGVATVNRRVRLLGFGGSPSRGGSLRSLSTVLSPQKELRRIVRGR